MDKTMKEKNGKKEILFFGLAIVVFLSISFIVFCYFSLFKKSVFWTLERSNFVLATKNSRVAIFSLQGKEGLFLNLPEKSKVKVTRGFGEYELGKVYLLGELEKKGGSLLKETVQENFFAPVFGYFYNENDFEYQRLSQKDIIAKIFAGAFKGKIKTDLSKPDLLLLYLRSKMLEEKKTKIQDFTVDMDSPLKDKRLRNDGLSIEVRNSTDHFGLAQQISQLLESSGAKTIRTADSSEKTDECILQMSKDLSKSYTFFWLSRIFNCRIVNKPGVDRSDILFIVGESYWKKLSERW